LKRQVSCLLDDQSSCPRISPTKLLQKAINKIQELFTSKDYAHYSTTAFSWLGKKTGEILVSATTWSRVVRELGLKRNSMRIYPAKPTIGIRASMPGQIWHLDQTILKLQDGTKAFVQCIIDNFSRYVLAWKVTSDYGGTRTKELLETAIIHARELGLELIPDVFVDSGVENINDELNQLVADNLIQRTIAQIDIEIYNSMIE
jgi:transposase InsO family protein